MEAVYLVPCLQVGKNFFCDYNNDALYTSREVQFRESFRLSTCSLGPFTKMTLLAYLKCCFACFVLRQLSSVSPSGRLQAIVRKVPENKGQEDKQFLEVHCRQKKPA